MNNCVKFIVELENLCIFNMELEKLFILNMELENLFKLNKELENLFILMMSIYIFWKFICTIIHILCVVHLFTNLI